MSEVPPVRPWLGTTPAWVLFIVLAIVLAGQPVSAQRLSYSSGENISPGFEGWEEDDDGSRYFLFGYMNRNWDEEPHIPIGPDNSIEPGGPDRGQPTHFLPRRNRFVFRVPVPDGFDADDELVWTLTVNGMTDQAFATLRTDYRVDNMIRASETGAIGAGFTNPAIRANKGPTLGVESETHRTVRVGEPLTLTALAEDDGVPRSARVRRRSSSESRRRANRWRPPRQSTPNQVTGLRVSWFVYRGGAGVMFNPPQVKVWEDTRTGSYSTWGPGFVLPDTPPDGKWVTQVAFDRPGTYVIRGLASDGALDVVRDLTITVTH